MSPDSKTTVSQLLLEKLALGELAPDEAHRVRLQLEREDGGVDRLHALRRSNEEILMTHPPRVVVPRIRQATRKTSRRSLVLFLAPVAALATVALVFAQSPTTTDGGFSEPGLETADEVRAKGDAPVLRVYRQTNDGNERLQPGATVAAGDLIQVAYVAMGNGYGVVFSIDGRGAVTLHHPTRAGDPQALLKSGEVFLPRAYKLDDAPLYERFFIVGSKQAPVDLDAVLAGARAIAADPVTAQGAFLTLPDGLEQYSITIRKEE